MARVKLIVTGDMEKLALHDSLRRFFPKLRDDAAVTWEKPRKVSCATTWQLPSETNPPSSAMQRLARTMLDEAGILPWRPDAADLVVVIEDLELANFGREAVVVGHFRAAIEEFLREVEAPHQARYRQRLRERCSFHLFNSMVESYLFGDPGALRTAGVASHRTPMLIDRDVEKFETNDPAWLPTCTQENNKKHASGYAWWRHECHPKKYLEHLTEGSYDEVEHGAPALKALDWCNVGQTESHVRVVRCLFEDLSEWFATPNPLGTGPCHPALFPSRTVNRSSMLLRNC